MLTASEQADLAETIIQTCREEGVSVTERLVGELVFDIGMMKTYDPLTDPKQAEDIALLGNLYDHDHTTLEAWFEVCGKCGGIEQVRVPQAAAVKALPCCGIERKILGVIMVRPRPRGGTPPGANFSG